MAHTYTADGTRRTAAFTAIIAIHVGAFLAIVAGMIPRPPVAVPPPVPVAPGKPQPFEGLAIRVERPIVPIPDFPEPDQAPQGAETPQAVPGAAGSDRPVDYRSARRRTHDGRMAALVAACYPAASRRLGEEGRGVARIALDPRGLVSHWGVHRSSGFARLDAAMGCVIDRVRFEPAGRDGRAVQSEVLLPIVFRLSGGQAHHCRGRRRGCQAATGRRLQ